MSELLGPDRVAYLDRQGRGNGASGKSRYHRRAGLSSRQEASRRTPVGRPGFLGVDVPRVVEKVTTVPFCTGVPDSSVTLAVITDSPLSRTTGGLATRMTVEPVGASTGRLSHAPSTGRIPSITSDDRRMHLPTRHITRMLST